MKSFFFLVLSPTTEKMVEGGEVEFLWYILSVVFWIKTESFGPHQDSPWLSASWLCRWIL